MKAQIWLSCSNPGENRSTANRSMRGSSAGKRPGVKSDRLWKNVRTNER
jgi:hypothetical protein